MSCLQNTQALPPNAMLTAGLTGQPHNAVMWITYQPNTNRVVTFDSSHQSPYEADSSSGKTCYKTPNGMCLGAPQAGVPWMVSSSAQMAQLQQMYTPYVNNASGFNPGAVALQLAAARSPSKTACAYKFLDTMPL